MLITLHDDTHAFERSWPKLYLLLVTAFRLDVGMRGRCGPASGVWRHSGTAREADVAFGHLPINAVATQRQFVNEREIANALIEPGIEFGVDDRLSAEYDAKSLAASV